MTNHFSFKRFLLLVKKQGLENLKLYLLCMAALAFILSFVFLFHRLTSVNYFHEESIYITYVIGLIIAGAIFASFSFEMLSSKDKAIYYLSFPASRLEKLLVVLFYNIIFFTLFYTLIFFIIKTIYWEYLESLVASDPTLYKMYHIDWKDRNSFMSAFPYFFLLFFAVQSFYILGSVYFNRFAFIKTTIAGSVIIFLFIWYVNNLSSGQVGNIDPTGSAHVFEEDGSVKVYALPSGVFQVLKHTFQFIWAPVFLMVTYFRLKEKQV